MYRHFKDNEEANLTIRCISLKKIKPTPEHICYLNLRQNQKIYELKRIFFYINQPLILSISYLPCSMFHQLEKLSFVAFENAPIYSVFEDHYGMTTVHNSELFSSTTADPERAEVLNVKVGTALLLIDMLSFTYREKIYEYRKSYCNTDEQKVLIEI